MPSADREYFRYDRRPPSNPVVELFADAPVTATLMALNLAVFVLNYMLPGYTVLTPEGFRLHFGRLEFWGHFSTSFALYGFQLWRLITFQFLHGGVLHLMFNMVSLYLFGPLVEQHLGSTRFLRFYLICGVGGAVAYLALYMKGVLIGYAWQPLVGASAGIFGILVAAAQAAPHAVIMPIFPPIPMRLRTAAWVFIGFAIWTVLTQGRNAGGEAAHLGGALVGFLLMQGERLLGDERQQRRQGSPLDGY